MEKLDWEKLDRDAEKHSAKLKKIKVFATDVDGVLTDGSVFYAGEEVGFNRIFNTADGYGLKLMKRFGLRVGVISGGASLGLRRRLSDLGMDFSFLGNEDKIGGYEELKAMGPYRDEEILYIGDEPFDLPLLKLAGFSVTVPHAPRTLIQSCDYTTQRNGGAGCVREVVELLCIAWGLNIPENGQI